MIEVKASEIYNKLSKRLAFIESKKASYPIPPKSWWERFLKKKQILKDEYEYRYYIFIKDNFYGAYGSLLTACEYALKNNIKTITLDEKYCHILKDSFK